jgi:hypothetical protein
MALRAQVVDLVRLKAVQKRGKRAAVCEIGIVQEEAVAGLVKIPKNVVNAIGIETRRTPLETMNFVSFGEKEFSQV